MSFSQRWRRREVLRDEKGMRAAHRLDRIAPYPFAQLERKIEERRRAGADVISLGIGDPVEPTPGRIIDAMVEQVRDPATHHYPSNRGRAEFRDAVAAFYRRRFGVELDPETQVIPALGSKECIYHLNFAFLDPGDLALASDPGYPVYTGGPLLAGAEPVLLPLDPDRGFAPDFSALDDEVLERARLAFLNYPNNPTGAAVPKGLFEEAVALARERDILVVHDNSYSEITFDGYVAPSFLATDGAVDVGVEVFSLSKGWNMTGWRCAAIVGNADALRGYWMLKTNVDSGMFDAVQMAGVEALAGSAEDLREARNLYQERRDRVVATLEKIGISLARPKGTIYVWAPVPGGQTSASFAEEVLERADVVVSPGSSFGPSGEGFFRISLTVSDERLEQALARMGETLGG
jgi:LL-diaminopimelate aminotransferase